MKTKYTTPIQRDILIIYTFILLAVGGVAWWAWNHPNSKLDSQQSVSSKIENLPITIPQKLKAKAKADSSPLPQVSSRVIPTRVEKLTPKVNTAIAQLEPQAYWLQTEGENIHLVARKVVVKQGVSKKIALTEALSNILATPQGSELTTTIPRGTKLLNLEVNKNEVHVNLSKDFTEGGGSTSMIYRVAQVLYTASSLDNNVKVYLLVEGKLIDENNPLGGEGVILTEPLTRSQFAEDFSVS
ncbi:MAG: GerMN domain-containing protein [Cyanomargarita calcarea GSE-NOS-MK-12-04C]|jgi:spore germination protein GerM|uniref:GerMN domain-containing protein n=1 Tax=Cyanomargarita calcarea GSE-NOS-MK-12-04C TaxID=2839659 RepID=A0A951QQ36_9CYAN|nr:GerMN domain-containing protein [Cyanomargarita calcarea GSE-NOS-MK-12-04C]